jgi:predicted nucleotidyltransferase
MGYNIYNKQAAEGRILMNMAVDNAAKEKAMIRLYELLDLQKEVERTFGDTEYNVFVFGSYLTTAYEEGESDIDIAIYTENFDLYKRLSLYLEEYFDEKGIKSDIFFIDLTVEAAIYCAPLKSRVQFTDYFPKELKAFEVRCRRKLEEAKARAAV